MRSIETFGFQQLQATLEAWPETTRLPEEYANENPIYDRIHQVLSAAKLRGEEPSFPNLAALLRQVLLMRFYAGSPSKLRVVRRSSWPNRVDWSSFGFNCAEHENGYLIHPQPWNSSWLNPSAPETTDIFADCFAMSVVRRNAEVPMDPFLKEATGYESYVCPGQREAVLSLLFMPAGSTIIVNLPTGAGKTLVAQVPLLLNGLHRGLTLFIVPTTALAIDHSRRMKELLSGRMQGAQLPPLAWHGELNDQDRQAIKTNIRQGTQGILFASPEAVTGALLPSLYSATKEGLLGYLIIDEAHLIAQWGDSFRPAFQALSGIRRGLLKNCGGEAFRTVLMSATFSPQNIETLDVLFSPPDNIQMVSAIHLRPEPKYWAHKAKNEAEKRSLVLEVLKHVPWPFIIYVTERDDARKWTDHLRWSGKYERIACFTGDTPNYRREQIIQKWVNNELDGIIATSAFGVGMDKSDVRSIIHATVPESLDRFYQEVGRGGRDGNASLSITVYTDKDVEIARRLSNPASIAGKNAYARWLAMFNASKRIESDDLVSVDVTVTTPHLQQQSDYNVSWNLRTLILMARAGLIQLDSMPPTAFDRIANEDEATYEERIERYWAEFYDNLQIQTEDPQHLRQDHFERAIGRVQQRSKEAARVSLDSLLDALKGRKEMGEALGSLYECHEPGRTVIVSKVCRGCPAKPMSQEQDLEYQIPVGISIEHTKHFDIAQWQEDFPLLPEGGVMFYPAGIREINDILMSTLSNLVARYGVLEVAAREELWRPEQQLHKLHRQAPDRVLVVRSLKDDNAVGAMLPLPRVSVLLPWGQQPIPDHLFLLDRPFHIILAPDDVQGNHPHKRLIEIDQNVLTVTEFLRVATQ
jgi:ATP-dependent DNA helicase RecQ